MNSSVLRTSAERVEESLKSGRYYYFPTPQNLDEAARQHARLPFRHTTQAWLWRQDLSSASADLRKEIVEMALAVNSPVEDVAVLNKMKALLPKKMRHQYISVLGFYLFLADAVSSHPNISNYSFFQAGRERLAQFRNESPQNWLIGTLNKLGLWDYFPSSDLPELRQLKDTIGSAVRDFQKNGTFMIDGEVQKFEQGWDSNNNNKLVDHSTGYMKHAYLICDPKKVFSQLRRVIERALGAKEDFKNRPMQEIYAVVKDLNAQTEKWMEKDKDGIWLDDQNYPLRKYILAGEQKRRAGLNKKISELAEEGFVAVPMTEEGRQALRKIFKFLPDAYFDIVEYGKKRIAVTEHDDLSFIIPEEVPMGVDEKNHAAARASIGNYNSRHGVCMVAKGVRERRDEFFAHALIHESWHMVSNDYYVISDPNIYGTVSFDGYGESNPVQKGKILSLYEETDNIYRNICGAVIADINLSLSSKAQDDLMKNIGPTAFADLFNTISSCGVMTMYRGLSSETEQKIWADLSEDAQRDLTHKKEIYRQNPVNPNYGCETPYKVVCELYNVMRKKTLQDFYLKLSPDVRGEVEGAIKSSLINDLFASKSGAMGGECLADIINVNSKIYVGYPPKKRADEVVANSLAEFYTDNDLIKELSNPKSQAATLLSSYISKVDTTYKEASRHLKDKAIEHEAKSAQLGISSYG